MEAAELVGAVAVGAVFGRREDYTCGLHVVSDGGFDGIHVAQGI